jgi:hypothetical protein
MLLEYKIISLNYLMVFLQLYYSFLLTLRSQKFLSGRQTLYTEHSEQKDERKITIFYSTAKTFASPAGLVLRGGSKEH